MKKLLLLSLCLYSFLSYSQTLGLQQFATGFTAAIELTHPVNDSRLFVVQQGGLIRIVNPDGSINATPFLNLSSLISTGSERGLLGLAFHPNYASNGLFFVNYTNTAGNTVIARYGVSADPNVANTTGTILMTISQPYSNHNGGTLRFGPDGYLYIGMGDGGGAGDTSGYAQNLDTAYPAIASNPSRIYLGKILRIDVNTISGLLNYGIPPTNPFAGQAGKEEIWAYGVRNPWKFSFNRSNGDLWVADVGQDSIEEIDKITSPLPNTALNFGWRCFEGNTQYSTSIGTCPAYASTVAPVNQYTHASGRCSITGGYFYSGTMYPNFQNKYFFADFCTAEIGYVNSTGAITWAYDAPNYLGTFGEDMNGELYVSINAAYSPTTASTIYKLVDTSLSVSEFERSGFSLYPNPAKTEIFIKNKTEKILSKVSIFDLTGKLVLTKAVENNETNPSVNIAALSNGLYLVSVEDFTGSKYQSKLIVNN
ncbi:MAG TPA: PQQ-dependent sugar dehydrogenase [Flavobacterium sp.]|uniref:PQQ-dependent sugar dehydrogenase n=1 Tax=Flavobacterium sp. TaxID=239 RepID=UPI002C907D84|nr:PQQ-dependent sugar dehydrogenase [Flavobacterium sp.]HNP32872.1 PQQ-dependent sugar dehydrogenase [Flavobacterium sp.]